MSILASKMIAINIVDMEDGHRPIADVQVTEKDARVAMLEAQVNELKQWQASLTPSLAARAYSSASEAASAPGSPHSFTSLDSSDLPQMESTRDSLSEKVEPQKKSNLRTKKNSSSKSDTDITSRIMTIIQGYGLLNLRADWRNILRLPFDLSMFVTNATDEVYVTKNFGLYDVFGVNAVEYGEPRMIGAQIRYRFGP